MRHFTNYLCTAASLLTVALLIQSCSEQSLQLEKQKIQFSLTAASLADHGVTDLDLPDNARARISIAGRNGESILADHEIAVYKDNGSYVTDAVDLTAGTYFITSFMIVNDSTALYATPKKGVMLSTSEIDALPYNFSITENHAGVVNVGVIDVRGQDLQKFGYASPKSNPHTLSLAAYTRVGGNLSFTAATAELRQNKKLIKTFSLAANVNTIRLDGDHKKPYTLTVYTANSARTQTFNMKDVKKESGKNHLQLVLEPALILSIESFVDVGNETEEYFNFRMDGSGAVNVNWGDGEQSPATLPFEILHEYISGEYTAIVTGDIHQLTDFSGFSYGSIILAITGLTNLTSLKTYDPSWGAVPIKVDLRNCKALERINVAKYGAPYETIDLRTGFQLPIEHHINSFTFDAPSFDTSREFISAEELESMVNNIYNNVINRQIHSGEFFVHPVVTPSPETQRKIDILKNEYQWQVGFNEEIYESYGSETGRSRTASGPDSRREKWLRERFANSKEIINRARVNSAVN